MAGLTIGNATNGTWTTGTTLTVAHTVLAHSNLLIFSCRSFRSAGVVTHSATYNGVAMTELQTQTSGNTRISTFYLLWPSTGANNIVLTFSATPDSGVLGAQDFGCALSLAAATTASATATSSSLSVPCTIGNTIWSTVFNNAAETPAAASGQTAVHAANRFACGYLATSTANPQASNWSWTSNVAYVTHGFEIVPSRPLGLFL